MRFIDKVLQEPSYGWSDDHGELVVPSVKKLYAEAFSRINIFKTKKNWIGLYNWLIGICMFQFFLFFICYYFSFKLVALSVLYGMVPMGTHATVWYHRYCTHKAYTFSHPFWKFVIQHLVVRTFLEETYVVSHHVHHARSDKPGDPYNSKGGLMYCMLADVNHQSISQSLSEEEYNKASNLLRHTGIWINGYSKYLEWGSITNPIYAVAMLLFNWMFWYIVLYILSGHGLACALFTGALCWSVLVRAFNYTSHGHGKMKHTDGVDFDRRNLSINQLRPGLLCGEWHNNHHLYPRSARAGFLPFQPDISWAFIWLLFKLGVVSSYCDNKKDFLTKYLKDTSTVSHRMPL